jgi:deoxyribodipyrimidine photolyase
VVYAEEGVAMMRGFTLGAASLVLVGMAALSPLAAQEVIKDPVMVRSCLCEQRQLSALLGTVNDRRQAYEASQQNVDKLNQELAQRRDQINVYSDSDVDAYKQLLAQSDRAAITLADQATPSYNDAVTRYNDALASYNTRCGGKSYDQAVYSAVQATLACPTP